MRRSQWKRLKSWMTRPNVRHMRHRTDEGLFPDVLESFRCKEIGLLLGSLCALGVN
jgi:hypothetical protein